ncbi:MAG: helix-turn-helix domain-containing protein [Gordonia sp. (in: high G+C Gram-positive bacteria)]|uniref:PucR family transcriptional regulator n=1 Tax=Gordonia sp. (in: high G+C Gram-positive bacteria) TaxID=84139 RepID=UPI0039E5C091
MQLRRLLDNRDLRLELIVDPGGARELSTERVFVTDQPLPQRYLSGGELLLTGLLFHDGDPATSERFLDSAQAGGALAVGAGVDHFGGIVPDHFVAACRTRHMPLFSVPADVSFADIIGEFISRSADRADRMRAALDQSRRLLSSLAAGRELDDLASIVVGHTGVNCKILTATGRPVCAVGRGLSDQEVDEVLDAARGTRHFPLAAADRTVLPVGRVRDATRAWYLVVDTPPGALSVDAMDAFAEFASVAALVHAREAETTVLRDRHDDLVVAEVLEAGNPSTELRSHATAGSESAGRPGESAATGCRGAGVVVVVRCGDPERVRPLTRDALAVAAGDATVAIWQDDVVAYVPTRAAKNVVKTLAAQIRRVVDLLDGPPSIGYCEIAGGASFDGAVRGARQAARFDDGTGTDRRGTLSVVSAASLGTAASLFSHLPDEVRLDFVHRVLGPLEEHDQNTRSGLLDTLTEFLSNDCSWVRTAAAMHMHQNTVRYRIGRAEQLMGRDLSDMTDRVDVHLALELR